jgi:uncharacterized protein (DUF2141 family)
LSIIRKVQNISKQVAFSVILGFVFLTLASFNTSETKCDLTIVITNINKACGLVQIGIYNKKENFPKIGKEYRTASVKVVGKEFKTTIKDLPVGNYAIALYHDRNSDGTCNANLIGVPTESYGFSNNIKPFLSAPSFQDTKFSHAKNGSIYITLFH